MKFGLVIKMRFLTLDINECVMHANDLLRPYKQLGKNPFDG